MLKGLSEKANILLRQHEELNAIIMKIRRPVDEHRRGALSVRDLCLNLFELIEHMREKMKAHLHDEEEIIALIARGKELSSLST